MENGKVPVPQEHSDRAAQTLDRQMRYKDEELDRSSSCDSWSPINRDVVTKSLDFKIKPRFFVKTLMTKVMIVLRYRKC